MTLRSVSKGLVWGTFQPAILTAFKPAIAIFQSFNFQISQSH